jgi:hypothetical protein
MARKLPPRPSFVRLSLKPNLEPLEDRLAPDTFAGTDGAVPNYDAPPR